MTRIRAQERKERLGIPLGKLFILVLLPNYSQEGHLTGLLFITLESFQQKERNLLEHRPIIPYTILHRS